jgi:hypothetical protein
LTGEGAASAVRAPKPATFRTCSAKASSEGGFPSANVANGLHAALRSYRVKVEPMLANAEQRKEADDGDQNSSDDYHISPQS